jgi:hypothetical protein
MAERNEHLVVIMLEHLPLGEEFEIWPPHITIVPWFPCDNPKRLDETLTKVAARHRPFAAKAGPTQDWGRQDKFKVILIEDNGELHKLHWDVFRDLEKSGFPIHQKDYLGPKYLVKPQFESGTKDLNKGVIKNNSIRRQILKDFEVWSKSHFIIKAKADSEVAGASGNRERFYLLNLINA